MSVKRYAVIALLAGTMLASGCSAKQAQQPAEEEKPVPVEVVAVSEGVLEDTVGITGRLLPNQEVTVSPKISGKVEQVHVRMGQKVKRGDLLFTLEKTDIMAQMKQAEAAYHSAEANLESVRLNAEQGILQAENAFKQAMQAYEDAKLNEQRLNDLYKEGAVSLQQLEQAQSALKNAEIALDNARKALENAQKKNGIKVAEASLEQAKANLDSVRNQLNSTAVTAPISGVVSAVNANAGEIVSPQSPVVTIVDLSELKVRVALSEEEVARVKVGDAVEVEIPALNRKVMSKIHAVSPVMDLQAKAYPVEILVPNDDFQLKADMVANVKFASNRKAEKAILIPRTALIDDNGKTFVFRIEGGIAKKVEVVLGDSNSELAEVKSGLSPNDQIVVKGQFYLSDGQKVNIVENKK